MNGESTNNIHITDRMVLLGIVLGILFISLDTAISILFDDGGGSLTSVLARRGFHVYALETIIMCMFVIFGVYSQMVVNKDRALIQRAHESEDRFRNLAEHTFDGIAIHRGGGIIEANDNFARMFGYSPDELVAKSTLDLITPETRELAKRHLESGYERPYEVAGLRKDGSTFEMEVFSRNITYNTVPARISTIRDISTRKQMERMVQKRQDIEDLLLRITSMFVGASDLDETIDRALADVGESTGSDRVYIFQMRDDGAHMDNTHEWCADGVAPEKRKLQGLETDGYSSRMSEIRRDRRGYPSIDLGGLFGEDLEAREVFENLESCNNIEIPLYVKGNLAGMLGFENYSGGNGGDEDQTMLRQILSEVLESTLERQEAERTLVKSERAYRALFEGGRDAVFIADVETGTIVDTNRQGERLLKRPREEIIGMHQTELHPPDSGEESANVFDEHASALVGRRMLLEVITGDGDVVPVEISSTVIEIDGKQYLQGHFRDVRDRVAVMELMTQERNRAELYLNVIGSDVLRINRAVIADIESTMQDGSPSNGARRCMDRTLFQARSLSDIITQVIAPDLLRGGSLQTEEVDLNHLISQAIEWVLMTNPKRRVEVNIQYLEGDARVMGNGLLLEAFTHVLDNAVKFDPHDSVNVQVRCGRARDGQGWMVRITDEGPGIPDEVKAEMFHRLRADRVALDKGLGMTMVHEIVTRLNGSVLVEDRTEGDHARGSTIVVLLPGVAEDGIVETETVDTPASEGRSQGGDARTSEMHRG